LKTVWNSLYVLSAAALGGLIASGFATAKQPDWITLFDGKSLKGWTPKIKGYPLGENFGDTFRVQNGAIVVRYDKYGGKFSDRFGHLFYKSPYSSYSFEMEYRFVDKQLPDGPGWAYRNSGVMLFGQPPETMALDQDFPVSAEVQLLGQADTDTGERTTANLCTPGTNVVMDGKLVTQHCINSKSKTFKGDQWVKLRVDVSDNLIVRHFINDEEVMNYSEVQYDPRDATTKDLIKSQDLKIKGGTLSLQSESHPVEFRNIRLKPIR